MPTQLSRTAFDAQARDRDNHTCIVPWCDAAVDEVHHIIERRCWDAGGYYLRNAASVCNPHHRAAEADYIPPQAFWYWLDVEPYTPSFDHNAGFDVDKWGEPFPKRPLNFDVPTLPNSPRGAQRTLSSVDQFLNQPLTLIGIPTQEYGIAIGGEATVRTTDDTDVSPPDLSDYPSELRLLGDVGTGTFIPLAAYHTEYNLWLSSHEVEHLVSEAVPVIEEYDALTHEAECYALHEPITAAFAAEGYDAALLRVVYPAHNGQLPSRFAVYLQS